MAKMHDGSAKSYDGILDLIEVVSRKHISGSTYYVLDFALIDSLFSCSARNSHLAIFDNPLGFSWRIQ